MSRADDIAARQAHVVGDGPRVAPLANEDLTQEDYDLVQTIRAAAGAGPTDDIPEYMRILLKHPELFRDQMQMGTTLFNGRIPARERELAVLRVGWLCRAPYEWGQHVAIAARVGLTSDDVARVILGADAAGWTAHEAAIVRGVDELLADQALSDATWATLAEGWDEAQLIEYPMMVGQYVATAFVQNTLRIPLADGNPGLTRR